MQPKKAPNEFLVLEELPDIFKTSQGDIKKSWISPKLQEQYRSAIKLPEVEIAAPLPVTEKVIEQPIAPMPQAMEAQPQPMAQMAPQQQMPMRQPQSQYPGLDMQANAIENKGILEGELAQEQADLTNEFVAGRPQTSPEQRVKENPDTKAKANAIYDSYEKAQRDADAVMIDPKNLWNKASTGQKIAGAIGLILSGIGSGLTGQRNYAIDIIQGAIQDDIQSQKENKRGLQQKASALKNQYDSFKNELKDETAALYATEDYALKNYQLKLQSTAAQYKSPIVQERAAEAVGQIQEKRDMLKMDALMRMDEISFKREQIGEQRNLQQAKAQNEVSKENQKLQVEDYGLARTEKEATALRETVSKTKSFINKLDDLIALREKYGSETFHGKAYNEMKSLHAQMLADYKGMNTLGTLDTGVLKLFDMVLSDPTGYGYRIDQYKKFREQTVKGVENNIKTKLRPDSTSGEQMKKIGDKTYKKVPGGWELQ
jgi:hypothetical protein